MNQLFRSSFSTLFSLNTSSFNLSLLRNMSKKALVFLATGAEEMETVITVDVLRRGGIDVTLAGVEGGDAVLCSRNVKVLPDAALSAVKNDTFDVIIVPGGLKGAETCANSSEVGGIISKHYDAGKLVAAICAGPTALLSHKIGYGKSVTSYPSLKDKFTSNYQYKEDRVVHDGNLITSQGPGTTFEFALKIVEYLEGTEKMISVRDPMRVK